MKNNKKNRGFSLVELIVVVAIMAVLVGVLAPSLLRYVEKTRVQKDISAISEVEEAIKIACADEAVNTAVAAAGTTGMTITITDNASTGAAYSLDATNGNALEKEVAKTITSVDLTSNQLNKKTVSLKAEVSNGTVTVTVTAGVQLTDDAATAWTNAGYTNGTATP